MSREQQPSQHERERIARWSDEAGAVERIIDGLGLQIDQGIREAVIGLRIFDIGTLASCEGHPDWGVKAPWIDIGAEVPVSLQRQLEATTKAHNDETDGNIREEIRRRSLAEILKAMPLLDEYYQGRNVASDRRLIIESRARGGRIVSQGGLLQAIRRPEEAEERLRAYQEEMASFAMFLREKYLHS